MKHLTLQTIRTGTSLVALTAALLVSIPALASEEGNQPRGNGEPAQTVKSAALSPAPLAAAAMQTAPVIEEENRYHLQLLAQIFDGNRDFSHSQIAGFARMRKGDESWSMLDFGDEAVVIESKDGPVEIGRFESTSGTEQAFRYNYSSKSLAGDSDVARYHNTFVRPQLDKAPALGSDAEWGADMSLAELGFAESGNGRVDIKLTRNYFSHEGKDFVLIEYEVPAFEYTNSSGEDVVHWARGISLMDPGFGEIYWNAAVHRATAQEAGGVTRPYRFMRSATAIGAGKKALIDPRSIPQVAPRMAHYTGEAAVGIIGFTSGDREADQLPIEVAAKLDVMALALGENSANQAPETSFGHTQGPKGNKVQMGDPIDFNNPVTGPTGQVTSVGQAVLKFIESKIDSKNALTPQYELILKQSEAFNIQRKGLIANISYQAARFNEAKKTAEGLFEAAIKSGQTIESVENSSAFIRSFDAMQSAAQDLRNSERAIKTLGEQQSRLSKLADLNKLTKLASEFAETKAGKALGGLGKVVSGLNHLSNVETTRKSLTNLFQDTSSGDIALTRQYGLGAVPALGLEIAGLFGDAYTGNVYGFTSDAIAITTGSVSDLFVSTKGLIQALNQQKKAREETTDIRSRRVQQLRDRYEEDKQNVLDTIARERAEREAKTKADWDKYYEEKYTGYHPNWDPKTKSWKPGTRQWEEQQELAREREFAEADFNRGQPVPKKKKIVEITFDWGERGYPVYDPAKHKKDPVSTPPEQQFSDIPDWLLEQWEKDAELAKRREELAELQSEILRRRRLTQEEKDNERAERIANSSFNDVKPVIFDPPKFTPVTWTPPVWTPPVWTPPVWVPPEFNAPEPSEIEWTKFSGEEWDFGGKVPSWNYGNLSGTVETDLSKWADWLATQNIRDLERLARSAGYPNLASALNDWKNLTDRANDSGFRQWAGRAPVCYMACAGTFGQWQIKASQLALGDILNDSREIFSTAGLSDISISGFVLRYILRDFGVEDGDIINIVISQFGRSIFETELSLLSAGTNFEINLRPGVASIVITAINEGAISPNTAEINLQNVVEGESIQTYSLQEGQTATLRVNPGRVGGIGSAPSSSSALGQTVPTSTGSMSELSQRILLGRSQGTQLIFDIDDLGITQPRQQVLRPRDDEAPPRRASNSKAPLTPQRPTMTSGEQKGEIK